MIFAAAGGTTVMAGGTIVMARLDPAIRSVSAGRDGRVNPRIKSGDGHDSVSARHVAGSTEMAMASVITAVIVSPTLIICMFR